MGIGAICVSGPFNSSLTGLCDGRPFLPVYRTILSVAAICGWVRFVTHAAKSHKKFGPLLVIMRKMITNDVSRFLVIQICFLTSFSTALLAVSSVFGEAPARTLSSSGYASGYARKELYT